MKKPQKLAFNPWGFQFTLRRLDDVQLLQAQQHEARLPPYRAS